MYNYGMNINRVLRGWYKLRWVVLSRDNFTCQYCGQAAPNVKLEVDHVILVSEGGTDNLDNLVTACFACNQGKGVLKVSVSARKRMVALNHKNTVSPNGITVKVLDYLKNSSDGADTWVIAESLASETPVIRATLHRLLKVGRVVKQGGKWFINIL